MITVFVFFVGCGWEQYRWHTICKEWSAQKAYIWNLSETLNEQNYDPVIPQERKIYKANIGKDKVLTWTTDKPNVSRKWNESNIIRNKPRPSRRAKDIKTPLDSWSLLMTDDILLEIVTTTHENI